jgi:RNA polymerase sigma-70 factor, ECF subfamily
VRWITDPLEPHELAVPVATCDNEIMRLSAVFESQGGSDDTLEAALASLVTTAQGAWPGVVVAPDVFVRHLAARLPEGSDRVTAIGALHGSDLYLACACAAGDVAALEALDKNFFARVPLYVARFDKAPAFTDEVVQRLRERVLVRSAPDQPPRIASYTGQGPLAAWLRVASVRIALGLRRPPEDEIDDQRVARSQRDPEMALMKARYGRELNDAFRETLTALGSDERTALRLHYIDGLTIEEIAALYKMGRTTAARWLARCRAGILEETRRRVAERLDLDPHEVKSLMRFARSQLEFSVRSQMS